MSRSAAGKGARAGRPVPRGLRARETNEKRTGAPVAKLAALDAS